MNDCDLCAEAERKAALWDAVGEPALALLREVLALDDGTGLLVDDDAIRALLARAEEAQP